MDLTKLSQGDQIIGVSGVVLLISSFLDWLGASYSLSANGTGKPGVLSATGTGNAWGYTLPLLAVLIGLLMVAYVVVKLLGVEIPAHIGPVTTAQILLEAAVIAFVFVLIKIIVGPNTPSVPAVFSVSKTREFGIFVGLVASAGLVAGAFFNLREGRQTTG